MIGTKVGMNLEKHFRTHLAASDHVLPMATFVCYLSSRCKEVLLYKYDIQYTVYKIPNI